MSTEKFFIDKALGFGWETMTSKFGTLCIYFVIPFLALSAIGIGGKLLVGSDNSAANFTGIILGFLQSILHLIVMLGMMRVAIRLAMNEEPSWNDFIHPPGWYINYLACSFLYGAIFIVGIILLIIPGIFWGVRFAVSPYLIAHRGIGPIAALKQSYEITGGAFWKIVGFGLVCMVIQIAGVLCFVLGLVPATMVTFVATAHMYTQLLESSGLASPQGPSGPSSKLVSDS